MMCYGCRRQGTVVVTMATQSLKALTVTDVRPLYVFVETLSLDVAQMELHQLSVGWLTATMFLFVQFVITELMKYKYASVLWEGIHVYCTLSNPAEIIG